MKINGIIGDSADQTALALLVDGGTECKLYESWKSGPFPRHWEQLLDYIGRRVTVETEGGFGSLKYVKEVTPQPYTFFYHSKQAFSQWYKVKFEVDGVTYYSAEQYMMAGKARLFNDDAALTKILATSDPRAQKALGREVKGRAGGKWDAEDIAYWNSKARDIVYEGNWHKFTQNEDIQEELLRTAGTILVEASPTDRLWGIGHSMSHIDDIECLYECHWDGVNWLGEVLTKVREDIVTGVRRTENFGWTDNIHLYEQAPPL